MTSTHTRIVTRLLASACLLLPSAVQAQMGDQMGDTLRTTLRGFLDVGYRTGGNNTGQKSGFSLGQFDLYITSRLSEKLSFLSETVFEYDEITKSFGVDLERAAVQYAISDQLRLTAGKVHTPLGYWNNAYHHGRVMQPTIERPQVVEFEDGGGPLPVHTVGLEFSGRDLSDAHLGFDILVGNGLGNRPIPDDVNDSQALAVSVHSQVTTTLRVGLSGYRDRLAAGSTNLSGDLLPAPMTQTIGGGFISYFDDRAEAVVEGHSVANESAGRTTTSPGWFAYGGVRVTEKFVPYLMHDDLRLADNDPYYVGGHTRREILGARYEQVSTAVYKLELRSINRGTLPRATELAAQLAVAF
jgi:hypothetical protein